MLLKFLYFFYGYPNDCFKKFLCFFILFLHFGFLHSKRALKGALTCQNELLPGLATYKVRLRGRRCHLFVVRPNKTLPVHFDKKL
jgi:hypothetical protein